MEYQRHSKWSSIVGNIICLIFGILVVSVTIKRWHERLGGAITIITSIYGLIVMCRLNSIALIVYAILIAIDFITILVNSILLLIFTLNLSKYCFDKNENAGIKIHDNIGCLDWRDDYFDRSITVLVFLLVSAVLRIILFLTAGLLIRFLSNDSIQRSKEDIYPD